jgi:transcription factor SFP1
MAVSLGKDYHMLSASMASLSTGNAMGLGSLGHSYSRGQLETLMTLRNEAEHTKDYECCGLNHNGLHALLEHVEDQHPYTDANAHDAGFSPVTLAMDLDLEGDQDVPSATHSSRSSTSPRPVPNYPLTPTSAAGPRPDPPNPSAITSLQLSDVLKSPGADDSTLALPYVGTSPGGLITPTATAGNSPTSAFSIQPKITPASRGAFLGGPAKTGPSRFDRAFNEVVAGTKTGGVEDPATATPPGPTAVAPGVLFTAAAALGMPSAPAVVGRQNGASTTTTTTAPPTPITEEGPKDGPKDDKALNANADRPKAPEPQLPQPSLFTTHKAWRCPNPGCNKAYKQSNGLKYHLQKG